MTADARCAAMDDALAELALDLLAGEERAAVVAHIDGCERCRRRAVELTAAADRLVALAPAAEPPPGFEEKVLAAIAPPLPATVAALPRRRRGFVMVAAVAAALVLLVGVGALVAVGRGGGGDSRETAMVAPGGADVGDAYLHDGAPAWVLVSVPAWADRWGSQPYTVRVTAADGSVTDLAGGDLKAGYGAWGTALPMAADDVRTVTLIGPDGRVWCTGTFT